MSDLSKLTPEQLEKMDNATLVTIICTLQEQISAISSQLALLTEQVAIMNQQSNRRRTKKNE